MGAAIAAAVIGAAGAAYAGSQASKASKEASAALGGMQPVDLKELPPPQTVDWQEAMRSVIGYNTQNLPMNMALANQVNRFNVNQAVRGYSTIQPYFKQLQEQIGRNASSFAKGELPADVVSSIGRAAASRGFASGIGMGSRGGGYNTALGALNLRNLGLTSLDVSKYGTELGMRANSAAASMTPGLFDPASMFMSPAGAVSAEFNNAGILNDWNRANTGIINAERTGNTELANSVLESQVGLNYQRQLANAQAVQSASSSVAGLVGGGAFGGMGGGGYGSSFGATQAAAPNNRITYSSGVGYSAVPSIIG